jgi:hypothetical protein
VELMHPGQLQPSCWTRRPHHPHFLRLLDRRPKKLVSYLRGFNDVLEF